MTKDPNFVSVRLPDDVANWLRDYATAHKMVRADKPNMGGSIISIVRAAMQGQTISNNVGQSSAASDVDIDRKINEAIESLNTKRIDDYKALSELLTRHDDELKELKSMITAFTTETAAPANSTQSPTSDNEGTSTPNASEISLESDTLPIIEAIANIESPLVENALPDITTVPTKTKTIKRSPKSKPKYTRDQLTKMKLPEVRSVYRDAIPFSDRNNEKHTKAEYATRDFMVEAILKAKTKS